MLGGRIENRLIRAEGLNPEMNNKTSIVSSLPMHNTDCLDRSGSKIEAKLQPINQLPCVFNFHA